MYKREFEDLLKKTLPRAVLLYGEEFFLSFYLDFYKKRLNLKEEILTQYFEEYDFAQAKNYLLQTSLFGGVNFLVIRTSKALPKKELDILLDLTSKSNLNYFLLLYDGDAKDAKKMHKSFEKNGVWVRFFPPNKRELKVILETKVKDLSLEISSDALEFLSENMEYNLGLIIKELEKLASLNKKIEKRDIEIFTSLLPSSTIDTLLLEIINKKDLIKSLKNILELGSNEFEILRAIEIFFNQIFLYHSYIKNYGKPPNSQEILGFSLPRHLHEQRVAFAMKIDLKKLTKIYSFLIESELKLKRAKPQTKESLLFGILIKIQKIL